jgi:hypothetical protein
MKAIFQLKKTKDHELIFFRHQYEKV